MPPCETLKKALGGLTSSLAIVWCMVTYALQLTISIRNAGNVNFTKKSPKTLSREKHSWIQFFLLNSYLTFFD